MTDAALVGRHAGVNLLVIRSGRHPMREIRRRAPAFGRNGVRVHGIVMNDVQLDRGLGRRSAYHYQYSYEVAAPPASYQRGVAAGTALAPGAAIESATRALGSFRPKSRFQR